MKNDNFDNEVIASKLEYETIKTYVQHNRKWLTLYNFTIDFVEKIVRNMNQKIQLNWNELSIVLNCLTFHILFIWIDPANETDNDGITDETDSILREADVLMAEIAEFRREQMANSSKFIIEYHRQNVWILNKDLFFFILQVKMIVKPR